METSGMDSMGGPFRPAPRRVNFAGTACGAPGRRRLRRRGLAGQRAVAACRYRRGIVLRRRQGVARDNDRQRVDFHFVDFHAGVDPSSITDFRLVGVADVQGTGPAESDGSVETLLFDTDMRFMRAPMSA
jgi:hypothetical protein